MAAGDLHDDTTFIRRVFIAAAIAALCWLVWALSSLFLLVFGAVLVALTLTALARPLMRLGLPRTSAVLISAVFVCIVVGSVFAFFGADIAQQVRSLVANLDNAANAISAQIQASPLGKFFSGAEPMRGLTPLIGTFVSWSVTLGQAVVAFALVVVGGLYIAIADGPYRNGFIKLIPPHYHVNVAATLDDTEEALHRWLKGQMIAMVLVGSLTAIGLSLAGVDSALALGLLAGLANFVPYLGSLAAALITLVVASSQGLYITGLAAGVMLAVQQIESNIVTPLVVSRAVSIEPAVGLFALAAMGILFGPLGILLGFPLTIVADIAIRRLYIRDALDEHVEILGMPAARSEVISAATERDPNIHGAQ